MNIPDLPEDRLNSMIELALAQPQYRKVQPQFKTAGHRFIWRYSPALAICLLALILTAVFAHQPADDGTYDEVASLLMYETVDGLLTEG